MKNVFACSISLFMSVNSIWFSWSKYDKYYENYIYKMIFKQTTGQDGGQIELDKSQCQKGSWTNFSVTLFLYTIKQNTPPKAGSSVNNTRYVPKEIGFCQNCCFQWPHLQVLCWVATYVCHFHNKQKKFRNRYKW